MAKERIVAVGLLTARDVELLGPSFNRIWHVEDNPRFPQLLAAIEADPELSRKAGAEADATVQSRNNER
jgi:hypothetical protein